MSTNEKLAVCAGPSRKVFFAAAIVAFLAMWNYSVEGGEAEDAVRAKLEKFLAVDFKEGTLPPLGEKKKLTPKTLSAYAASISGVDTAKSEGLPSLVYFFVQEDVFMLGESESKGPNLEKQVKQCAKLERKCFSGKNVEVGTLAKAFFCMKVDVTTTMPKENQIFNALRAPLVLIVPPNSAVKLLSGKGANKSVITSEMTKILQRKKINVPQMFKDAKKMLSSIRKLENNKYKLEEALQKIQSKMIDAEMSGKASKAAKYEKEREKLDTTIDEIREELLTMYEEFQAMLQGPEKSSE